MADNEENQRMNVALIHLLPDGEIESANDIARELFELEHHPTSTNLLDITDDPFLQSQLKQCLSGELNYFVAHLKNQKSLFLFQRLKEENQPEKLVLIIFNAERLAPETEDHLNTNLLTTIGQMSAGIAHEVRNPLTSVKGFLQLLGEGFNERYLEIAQNELDRAVSTLNDLLS